jgi:hypothetical protein
MEARQARISGLIATLRQAGVHFGHVSDRDQEPGEFIVVITADESEATSIEILLQMPEFAKVEKRYSPRAFRVALKDRRPEASGLHWSNQCSYHPRSPEINMNAVDVESIREALRKADLPIQTVIYECTPKGVRGFLIFYERSVSPSDTRAALSKMEGLEAVVQWQPGLHFVTHISHGLLLPNEEVIS